MFLLVPAHPGFPGQIPQSRKTVVCVCELCAVDVFLYQETGCLCEVTDVFAGL